MGDPWEARELVLQAYGIDGRPIYRNRVSDEGLGSLGQLPALEELLLSWNDVRGTGLGDLAGAAALEHLDIRHNRIHTGEGLELLSALPSLRRLNLYGNQIDDTGLSRLLEDNAEQIWALILDPRTHVYLAGLPKTAEDFFQSMKRVSGSAEQWPMTREAMIDENRWSELLYS